MSKKSNIEHCSWLSPAESMRRHRAIEAFLTPGWRRALKAFMVELKKSDVKGAICILWYRLSYEYPLFFNKIRTLKSKLSFKSLRRSYWWTRCFGWNVELYWNLYHSAAKGPFSLELCIYKRLTGKTRLRWVYTRQLKTFRVAPLTFKPAIALKQNRMKKTKQSLTKGNY